MVHFMSMQRLLVSQVGPYTVRVDALVGEGGFASIYRVQDQTTTQVHARTLGGRQVKPRHRQGLTVKHAAPNQVRHHTMTALDHLNGGARPCCHTDGMRLQLLQDYHAHKVYTPCELLFTTISTVEGQKMASYELELTRTPLRIVQMYALKHARMGGNPEAIADVKNEVDVMKAVRGHPHMLTLRAVVMQGPPGAEVRVIAPSTPDLPFQGFCSCGVAGGLRVITRYPDHVAERMSAVVAAC